MKTNQIMTRKLGRYVVNQRTKDAYFNATSLLKQWNDITGLKYTIAEFLESYIPNMVRDELVMKVDNKIYLPIALEPQLRLYAANYNLELYNKLDIDNIDGVLTWFFYGSNKVSNSDKPSISTRMTYLMIDETSGAVKIGQSSDPKFRERTLAAQIPRIKLIAIHPKDIERELHHKYKRQRMRGEWFNLSGEEVDFIINTYGFIKKL